MSGTIGFFIAVGGVSLILYLLMGRADRVRDRRSAYADGSSDTSGISAGNDASLLSWFGSRAWSSTIPARLRILRARVAGATAAAAAKVAVAAATVVAVAISVQRMLI